MVLLVIGFSLLVRHCKSHVPEKDPQSDMTTYPPAGGEAIPQICKEIIQNYLLRVIIAIYQRMPFV